MPTIRVTFTGLVLFARHPNDARVDVMFRELTDGHHSLEHVHPPLLFVPPSAQDVANTQPARVLNGNPLHLEQWSSAILGRGAAPVVGPVQVDNAAAVRPPTMPESWSSFDYIPNTAELFPEATIKPTASFQNVCHKWQLQGGRLFAAPPSDPRGKGPWTWLDNTNAQPRTRWFTDVAVYEYEHDGTQSVALVFERPAGTLLPSFRLGLRSDQDVELAVVCHPAVSGPRSGYEIRHLGMFADVALALTLGREIRPFCPPQQCPDDPLCPPQQVRVQA